jgi:protein-disulfide isomerase
MPQMKSSALAAVLAASLAAAAAAATGATQAALPRAAAADTLNAARFEGRSRGSAQASVTVYELSDFQCRYCRQSTLETFPALDSLYVRTGKVRWVFMSYPKPRIHRHAVRSAEFAFCSAREGRFWEMHHALFERQPEWAPLEQADDLFFSLADSLRVDRGRLSACLESGSARAEIEADVEYPASLGIGGVPAFVVDDRMIVQGARPLEVFVAALDSVLAAKGAGPHACGMAADTCTEH